MRVAAARREPIPVYAEMSSINPVFLMPKALAARAEQIGAGFTGSLTMGAGQFCTNPGLVLAIDGPDLERFLAATKGALSSAPASTMLTAGIHKAYQTGVARLAGHKAVEIVAEGKPANGPTQGQAALFITGSEAFARHAYLEEEVFGAASLVIRCPDVATMRTLAEKLEGQLTPPSRWTMVTWRTCAHCCRRSSAGSGASW